MYDYLVLYGIQENDFVTFPSCQRTYPHQKPREAEPNRSLEDEETNKVLMRLKRIFGLIEELQLLPPFREVRYYRMRVAVKSYPLRSGRYEER